MQSFRSSVVRSGKVAGTRSHTLPTPGAHLPKANPALPYDKAKHFRPLASPRGIFSPFLAHFVERDRQPQTSVYSVAFQLQVHVRWGPIQLEIRTRNRGRGDINCRAPARRRRKQLCSIAPQSGTRGLIPAHIGRSGTSAMARDLQTAWA